MIVTHQYQNNIIDETRSEMLKGKRSVLITSPTGSGKTILSSKMMDTCSKKGGIAWFIVHRRELIKQSIKAFNLMNIPHGVISAGFQESKRMPVQIASIQTLIKRYDRYKTPNIIMWDECHHIGSASWSKIYNMFSSSYNIGLTATPLRLDGKGLGNYFDSIVHGPSVKWLIEQGYLCPYKIYAPSHINKSDLHTRMGDYVKSELNELVDRPTITGDAIKHYKKLCNNKRVIVFCVSVVHSKHVVDQFNSEGINAAHVDGESSTEYRDAMIERFQKGELKVLSNVDLFGEGFDLPAMDGVILLRPTQSLGLYLQQVGRALRPLYKKGMPLNTAEERRNAISASDKPFATILDHVSNCETHGLPDDERDWELTSDKISQSRKSDDGISVKICPKCFAAQFSGKPVCLYCGNDFPVNERKIDYVDGELVEIDITRIKKENRKRQGQCRTLEELIDEGKRRKMKRPHLWAKHVFNSRQNK